MQWNTLFLWLSPLLLVLVVALRLWLARNANAAVRADIEEGLFSLYSIQ